MQSLKPEIVKHYVGVNRQQLEQGIIEPADQESNCGVKGPLRYPARSDPCWQTYNKIACCLWCKFSSRKKYDKSKWLPVCRSASASFHRRYSLEVRHSLDSHHQRHWEGLSKCFSWPQRSWLSTFNVGRWCDKQTPKHSSLQICQNCLWCLFQSTLFTERHDPSPPHIYYSQRICWTGVCTWMIMWVAMI